MSERERDEFGEEPIAMRRERRRVFWLGAVAAGVVAAIASAVALSGEARAMRGLLGMPHGHGATDREAAREHAELAAEWLLRSVDASPEQQARVREIVDASLDALAPLAEQHRAHREEMLALLAEPAVDRAALEKLRAQELALADQASRLLSGGIADLAEALTPAQRGELLALAARFHH